jgi:hypothetical protein
MKARWERGFGLQSITIKSSELGVRMEWSLSKPIGKARESLEDPGHSPDGHLQETNQQEFADAASRFTNNAD